MKILMRHSVVDINIYNRIQYKYQRHVWNAHPVHLKASQVINNVRQDKQTNTYVFLVDFWQNRLQWPHNPTVPLQIQEV